MKKRIPLKLNTELRCLNRDGGLNCFYIGEPIGLGGTCIVYEGYYIDNMGNRKTVRIKECYPYKLHIVRAEDSSLDIQEKDISLFDVYKERLRKSYKVMSELFRTNGLTNSISNAFDIYELNNTVYIVTTYTQGMTLSDYKFDSLRDAVKLVIGVAKNIGKIHELGYLYLDIKPDNIFVYEETKEIVQLFDFDSVIPINTSSDMMDYRISYSNGFAPIEQKKGVIRRIGPYSDVYSIGALLFFLVYGKTPTALDCEQNAKYDSKSFQWGSDFQDKLYNELSILFANTLCSYYKDRYSSMKDVEKQLFNVLKYADLSMTFIHSSVLPEKEFCVGRSSEIGKIEEVINLGSKCVFITGMGGIGKSTVVRKWIRQNHNNGDSFVYLYEKKSVCQTIIDDENCILNNYEKGEEESDKEYYTRKLKGIRQVSNDSRVVIVLDNFNGEIDEDFCSLIATGAIVIAITRQNMISSGYPQVEVNEIENRKCLYEIFVEHLGKSITEIEYSKIDRIIKLVEGHTLSIELIAKQISKSYLNFDEAINLMRDHGFSEMAPEKLETYKDGKRKYDRFGALLGAVYDAHIISEKKKNILKIVSLFDAPGISVRELQNLAKIDYLDDINELQEAGWIYIVNGLTNMHPLVQETIHHMNWDNENRAYAENIMINLFNVIKLNGKRVDHPNKFYDQNKKIEERVEKSDFASKLRMKRILKKGANSEVVLERILVSDENVQANQKLLEHVMMNAKSIINYCGRDEVLLNKDIYKDLMYVTVINSHKDQEDYIIKYSERMFNDKKFRNPYAIMELYDYVVYILCQKGDLELAEEKLDEAKQFAKKQKNNHLWGLYYDCLMDFWETILDGAYMYQNQDEQELTRLLLDACDKAVYHMSKSKYEKSRELLAKYLLGKACILIRSFPEKTKEIGALIKKAKLLIEEYTLDYSKVRATYYMTLAWYYSLCKPEMKRLVHYLELASEIYKSYGIAELDRIDYYFVPAANMMLEMGKEVKSLELLSEAVLICKKHNDSIPFIRKEMDLYGYMLDVYYEMGDLGGSKKMVKIIDDSNVKYTGYIIQKEITEEFRSLINS